MKNVFQKSRDGGGLAATKTLAGIWRKRIPDSDSAQSNYSRTYSIFFPKNLNMTDCVIQVQAMFQCFIFIYLFACMVRNNFRSGIGKARSGKIPIPHRIRYVPFPIPERKLFLTVCKQNENVYICKSILTSLLCYFETKFMLV